MSLAIPAQLRIAEHAASDSHCSLLKSRATQGQPPIKTTQKLPNPHNISTHHNTLQKPNKTGQTTWGLEKIPSNPTKNHSQINPTYHHQQIPPSKEANPTDCPLLDFL